MSSSRQSILPRMENAFRGVVNPALSVIGRGQPIRCLVSLLREIAYALPRNKPAFNSGTGKDRALQATRAGGGHNGLPVPVTRTRRNVWDSAKRSRTHVVRSIVGWTESRWRSAGPVFDSKGADVWPFPLALQPAVFLSLSLSRADVQFAD